MICLLFPPFVAGLLGSALLIACLVFAFLVFLPFAVLKLLIPVPRWRRYMTDMLLKVMVMWGRLNSFAFRTMFPVQWEVEIRGTLDRHRSYMLVCNHQSWIDILLLAATFSGRTAPLCFFLKRELLWMPIIGFACWALDFPFMHRHSRAAVAANPALADEDLEATRRSCERFRERAVTVVNFAEGTRYSEGKRVTRQSPFRHLLRPKSAGTSFALSAMGDQFAAVLDVTICYRPSKYPVLWSFVTGEQANLSIIVDVLPVPKEFIGSDYQHDEEFRTRFQAWLNALWAKKDALLDSRIAGAPAVRPRML